MVRMANPGGPNLDQDLVAERFGYLDALKRKTSFAIRDGCWGLHPAKIEGPGGGHNR